MSETRRHVEVGDFFVVMDAAEQRDWFERSMIVAWTSFSKVAEIGFAVDVDGERKKIESAPSKLKAVLRTLHEFSGSTLNCTPDIPLIMYSANAPRRTISRAVSDLVRLSIVAYLDETPGLRKSNATGPLRSYVIDYTRLAAKWIDLDLIESLTGAPPRDAVQALVYSAQQRLENLSPGDDSTQAKVARVADHPGQGGAGGGVTQANMAQVVGQGGAGGNGRTGPERPRHRRSGNSSAAPTTTQNTSVCCSNTGHSGTRRADAAPKPAAADALGALRQSTWIADAIRRLRDIGMRDDAIGKRLKQIGVENEDEFNRIMQQVHERGRKAKAAGEAFRPAAYFCALVDNPDWRKP